VIPGRSWWPGVDAFDRRVDQAFTDYLRGRRPFDAVMYGASALGDHGILWLALAAVQSARRRAAGEQRWRSFVRLGIGIGIESALVNGPVKMIFRRTRPVGGPASTWYLRQPRTSSFPSGHATSAFCAAALLRDGDGLWPLYYAAAVLVAASRVHVRIHYASDVAAGALIGAALGELARHLAPLDVPSSEPDRGLG
jgi:undecaprenyl-diphosphatase